MACSKSEVQLHSFLTSELYVGKFSASRLGQFTPREKAPVPTEKEAGRAPELVDIFEKKKYLSPSHNRKLLRYLKYITHSGK